MTETSPSTPLPTRRLGDSGLEASAVGLGCNNFGGRLDGDATAAVLEAALDAGITFFDTADIYGGGGESERLMGMALAGRREPSAADLAELDRIAPSPVPRPVPRFQIHEGRGKGTTQGMGRVSRFAFHEWRG